MTADLDGRDPDGLPADEPRQGGPALAVAAGAVPALIGLAALWPAVGLGLGSLTEPGPGLWPAFVAVLLVAAGAVIVRGALTARGTADTEAFTRGTAAVALGAASLAAYTFLFELVGFEIPTVLLLAGWLRFLGGEKWITTAVVAVLATVAAHLLFITALGVPLPHLIGS
ncbi:tripartite tricarboxylate transporter TctB family protein [Spirillospora sp. NPDC047279]|uniref:tripartite tricarboxylate transporter TctB family protein n=1 Tax=Spirillospora sp. NPDC047279 TaxID=3155478 RepID=UPI00340C3284